MSSVRCSQGHQNISGSRFCHLCGEKLAVAGMGIYAGLILGDRYRITRQLGHGGFGRTYLAEDINRFNEACVLKEFAPQVQGTYALQKSEELFEREAGVLYKLQHPQIPRFRELFRANFEERGHLFLVQDYVEGRTYRQLLDARMSQGLCFDETEVTQLLLQLLPVLQYIHSVGVIHRDIAPDNLILRYSDQLPVLIDFGGVKRIAAVAASQYVNAEETQPAATRVGKVGYAPVEQMQLGRVFPHSDLYALAVTVLVLLTARDPQELLDDSGALVSWKRLTQLSPKLTEILERMLAPHPSDRYQSAAEVIEAMTGYSAELGAVFTQAPSPYQPAPDLLYPATEQAGTQPVGYSPDPGYQPAPTYSPHSTYPSHSNEPFHSTYQSAPVSARPKRKKSGFGGLLLALFLLGIVAGLGWWSRASWLPLLNRDTSSGTATDPDTTSSNFSPEERARKESLSNRRESLGVDSAFLIALTDESFKTRYPDQAERALTTDPKDAEWRAKWDAIAANWLDILEKNLSPDARRKLGSYSKADQDAWKKQVNQLYVGSRSLNDLTDAQFLHLFPRQRGQDFIDRPIGQVWQAIAADKVKALQGGSALERIRFAANSFSEQADGTLAPGEGKVYIVNLSAGQIMRLSLQAPSRSTLLSIYLPRPTQQTPFYLADSRKVTWSGSLTQSGFYEIVVVSTAREPFSYTLNLAVDNVTSTPVEPSTPESPEAKN